MEEKIKKSLEWWERLFTAYRICFTHIGDVPAAQRQLEELEKEMGVKFPPRYDYLDLALRWFERNAIVEKERGEYPFSEKNGGPNIVGIYNMAREISSLMA